MASSRNSKGKKVVNQDELRRLMREKQRESTSKKKRIESPLAKYNSLGHLSCVLCNVPVKSEILWQTHILGKQHKEKVVELKERKPGPSGSVSATPTVLALKRKPSEPEHTQGKKGKFENPGLPAGFFDGKSGPMAGGSKQPCGLGFLAGNYDNEDSDVDDKDKKGDFNKVTKRSTEEMVAELPHQNAPGLPTDFFDSSIPSVPVVSHSGSILKAEEPEKVLERKENTAEALPEGFFDDPVRDAKVRKVDAPKDQMDKEWEEFQKEMRQVNNASEAIVAEDDEEGRLERQIDEIDEQIECYRRVEVLRDKRDVVKEKLQEHMGSQRQQDVEDEEDEEELLHILSRDWRAKGALS